MTTLWDRIFGRRPPAPLIAAPEPVPAPDEQTDMLGEHIRRDVAAGFYDEDAILTNAAAAFEDEIDAATLRREAQRLLRAALAEQAEAMRDWPERTDCDRLDDAFDALEAGGVIARHNFTCCGTCGSAEIWDEIGAVEDAGGSPRGYAFYHMQDTEHAAEGEGLYLNYGACEEGEEAALAVGREIVAQLEAHGLSTDWDGSWGQRIGVTLDWKRRR